MSRRILLIVFCLLVRPPLAPGGEKENTPGAPEKGFSGQLKPVQKVDVYARGVGMLKKVLVQLGDRVKKGDLLFEIDAPISQIEMDIAKAKLILAEAQHKRAEVDLARVRLLVAGLGASKEDLEIATHAAAAAGAEVALAKANLERANIELGFARVTAPINGIITRLDLSPGSLVTPTSFLAQVMDTEKVVLHFEVPEGDVPLFLKGKDKEIEVQIGFQIEEGYPHRAKVTRVVGIIDPATRQAQIQVEMPNPKGALLPGQSARVRLAPRVAPKP